MVIYASQFAENQYFDRPIQVGLPQGRTRKHVNWYTNYIEMLHKLTLLKTDYSFMYAMYDGGIVYLTAIERSVKIRPWPMPGQFKSQPATIEQNFELNI